MRIRGGRVRRGRIGMRRGASTGPTCSIPRSKGWVAYCSLLPAVPFPGSYDLVNARVSVSGGIHLVVGRDTQVVPNGRRGLEGIAEVYLDNWPRSVGVA